MGNDRRRNATLNIVFALVLQLISALSGLILPKLLIQQYGSEVNGLIASITQFLAYISLLEAGVGGVIRAALYKPLAEENTNKISGIIKASKVFYEKIGRIFLAYLAILCVIYPILANSSFNFIFIVTMILILSLGTILQYFVSLPYVALVTADQKGRIIYFLDTITLLLNIAITFILVWLNAPIHVVKALSCLVFALKPLFLYIYVKKKYTIDFSSQPDNSAIKQRWNGLAHHIAFFVHSNTDILVLTFFTNLTTVSIYSIYRSVVVGIEKVVMSVSDGSSASIGNLLAVANKKEIDDSIDLFEFVQCAASTILFSITALMIIPFFNVYAKNITDGNYIQPVFGYILVFSEFIYCVRVIYSTIALNAGKYKETQKGAIAECVLNLLISIILVRKFGLVGVAIGTAVAMSCRYIFDIAYLSRHLIHRTIKKFLRMLISSVLAGAISILLCNLLIDYNIYTWGEWALLGIITGVIVLVVSIAVYYLFYRKMVTSIGRKMIGRLRRSK